MKLSIVTTLYNSASYLSEFCSRVSAAAKEITPDYEIILVNDGSPDDSLDIARDLLDRHPEIQVIDLSRNFGQHKAIMTGLTYTTGELVFLLDSDLEEQPEFLPLFYEAFNTQNQPDVVYGVQQQRKGGLFERISGALFYWLINLLSDEHITPNLITARLMTRRYVDSLIQHRDRELFIAGLWATTGYRQVPVKVEKFSKDRSDYNFSRKLKILVDSITSFSNRPLIAIFYLGALVTLLSFAAAIHLVIKRIFFNVMLTGWPSLIVSIWILGGLTLFCLGIIGIYLSKIFMETKERPYTIIRKVYKRNDDRA